MTVIVPAIVLVGLVLSGWIIYRIGYSAGWDDGCDHTLDQIATRAERHIRYNVDGIATRRLQTWSKSVREVK